MNVQYQKSMQVLLGKLSAVRVTLSDEEQVLLDWLLQGARTFNADEVVAHGVIRKPEEAVSRDADEVMAHGVIRGPEEAVSRDADEVFAHGVIRGPEEAISRDADEVFAHGVIRGPEESVVRGAGTVTIIYDPEREAYTLQM